MANIDVYIKTTVAKAEFEESPASEALIARLSQNKAGAHFTYQLNADEAVSLTMPLRNESYHSQALPPIVQMNLPEGRLREALERATAKQFGSDDLSLLAILGGNQIGRLAYALENAAPSSAFMDNPNLSELLGSQDAGLFEQLLSRFALTSGVAGVQPKVLMEVKIRGTLLTQKLIVKSWVDEFPQLAANEFFCMSVVKACGLVTPSCYLSENGQLFISERFDIDVNFQPLGFEDFCVLQGRGTKEKYDASLESCTHTIRQFVSPELQRQALADFFKLTLLNIRLRNGDAHLKNSGVIYPQLRDYQQGELPSCQRQLAPIFDVVSTTPYLPNDTMALSLTGSKRWPKWKVLQRFGQQHCLLKNKEIDHIYQQVDEAINQQQYLLSELSQKHADFIVIAEAIEDLILASRF
ncbi:MAG: type II toxin-antitoxin system HipA family toxin [Pseudomonadales bacterium]|nr:type II toxin-antitoxin system HipA family toxin [Pseudomonadales bacterium]